MIMNSVAKHQSPTCIRGLTPLVLALVLNGTVLMELQSQEATGQVEDGQRGDYYSVEYPGSAREGELQYGVTFKVWIPRGASRLRGVIVHQHGCGKGACDGGATAAHDLHWQALARKWDCALLGPSYRQEDGQNCRLWCDPRNGSEKAFLKALDDLAALSKHEELNQVPWCLWGHSGGGFWASIMQTLHPHRIVAIWFRSGTAYATWEKGEIPKPIIPETAYGIPMICNPGVKENEDERFRGAWTGAMAMFKAYRARGALIGFAPDPRSGHECADSRYLAIPFFDACLSLRLPDRESNDIRLKSIDPQEGWLAALLSDTAVPSSKYSGESLEAVWLPNEQVAKAWREYVREGAVSDVSKPPSPHHILVDFRPDGAAELAWTCDADFESGLRSFVVLRDGKRIANLPEKPIGRYGRPLFQSMSYHDTPDPDLPTMQFVDKDPLAIPPAKYQVIAVNSVGLESEPANAQVSSKVP